MWWLLFDLMAGKLTLAEKLEIVSKHESDYTQTQAKLALAYGKSRYTRP